MVKKLGANKSKKIKKTFCFCFCLKNSANFVSNSSHMSNIAIKEELLQLPDLQQLIGELQTSLNDERSRRLAFYDWAEADQKVEFINGVIIENSPAADEHTDAVGNLHGLSMYQTNFEGTGKVKSEKAMVSLTRNDYEPDLAFWRKDIADTFQNGQTHYPAPDWICEVLSLGTAYRDRGVKFRDYAAHGVKEYWIVDPRKQTVEQYILPKSDSRDYELLKKVSMGDHIESTTMTGFKIPVAAIFDAEMNRETLKNLLSKFL
jgi:Uma2 family endonuclease